MSRSTGPVRTLLLVLVAGCTGLLLGLGAVSVASALGSAPVQELGDPVVFDPAAITPTAVATPAPADEPDDDAAAPAPEPVPVPAPTSPPVPTAPSSGTSAEPHQVAPAAPSHVNDDDDQDDDADDDDADDD